MINSFNNLIGDIAEGYAESRFGPRKTPSDKGNFLSKFIDQAASVLNNAERDLYKSSLAYSIKAGIFNSLTVTLVAGVIFTLMNPIVGLTLIGLSLAGKVFIQTAIENTILGNFAKDNGNFFYKDLPKLS